MQIKKLISKIVLNPLSKRAEFISLGLCLVIATSIFTYATWGGLIWTSDSFHYWAASRSWQEGFTLQSADGGSYLFWPPLYPVLLSLFSSENSYYIAHIIIFNASLLFIYFFLKKSSLSKKYALVALFSFSFSVFPYLVASFLWSETFFILLMYAGLYFYILWEENKNPVYIVLWVISLAAMCLQRNAGVFILVGLSIYALFQFISFKNFRKFITNAVGIFMAILPIAFWNLSTLVKSSDTVSEENISFFNGIFLNFENILIRLFYILFPVNQLGINNMTAGILLMVIILILIFTYRNHILLILFLTYLMIFSFVPLIEPESIDRLLTPIIPMFIILMLRGFNRFLTSTPSLIKFVVAFYLVLLISYNVARTINNVKMWHERSITNPKAAKIFF